MDERPENHKFDTLSLLASLKNADTSGYSIDDILDEFGGRKAEASPDPTPPVTPPEENIVDQIQQAIDREMDLAVPAPVIHLEKREPPADPDDLGDPELNRLFRDKKTEEPPNEPDKQEEPQEKPHRARREDLEDFLEDEDEETPRRRRNIRVVEHREEPVPDAAETFQKYARGIRPARSKMTAVLLLTLAAIFWTAANQFGFLTAEVFAGNRLASKILLGMMALCALLSLDAVREGVRGIFSFRFTLNSLIVLTFLVAGVDAALCGDDTPIPFCAVVCLEFLFAAWGSTLQKVGVRRALKPLQKLEQPPAAAIRVDGVWEGGSLIAAGPGSVEEHVRGVLSPNLTDRWMRVYAPIAALCSLALAFVVKVRTGNSLTWAWSSMMIGALPVAGFISYYRPFAILSGKLLKQGAAVGGWTGAKRLGAAKGVMLRDGDVFPADHVTLNGMKVYGSYSVGQTVGYAAAVVEASGSGLAPLFQELRDSNNGRHFGVSQLRRYEGGGYGAEIGGDVVLLGSLRFMQLMGVYMHEGTKVRNAVYLSVGGEMCGVFALNYAPSGKVRKSLRQIVDANGLTPVFATRDFLITPVLVEERYKVPNGSLRFPTAEERSRLCQLPEGAASAEQGAVLTKEGVGAYADAVVGARILRLVTGVSTAINVAGGVIGLLLMFFLTYLGAQSAVTAMNMLLFALVWALPSLILTNWAGRY
ncbi:MAG: hypothetical protein VB055_03860 [Oscillospiraceae bacterium]|nr:hypothetical protein [Oscillospiraceae bacterium]